MRMYVFFANLRYINVYLIIVMMMMIMIIVLISNKWPIHWLW